MIQGYLNFYIDDYYQGKDQKKLFEKTIDPTTDIDLIRDFTMPDGTEVTGEWFKDKDPWAEPDEAESRIYCTKGKAKFTFTGTNLTFRVEHFWSWGSFDVYIDGQKPSDINDTGIDTVTCDSSDPFWAGNFTNRGEVTVIRNLEYKTHTVEIYANNDDQGWIAITNIKIEDFTVTPKIQGWFLDLATSDQYGHNRLVLQPINHFSEVLLDLNTTILSESIKITDSDNNSIADVTKFSTFFKDDPIDPYQLFMNIDIQNQKAGTYANKYRMTYLSRDDDGIITRTITLKKNIKDDTTQNGTWYSDYNGTDGRLRIFSNTTDDTVTFTDTFKSLTLSIQKDYGWGQFDVYIDDELQGTYTCNDDNGGGYNEDITFSFDDTQERTLKIQVKEDKYVVLQGLSIDTDRQFSQVDLEFELDLDVKYVPPFEPTDVNIQIDSKGNLIPSEIDPNKEDLSIPRTNKGYKRTELYIRKPIHITCYVSGFTDLMKQFDIAIIEPKAMSYQDVKELKDRGIKVFGYISYGEENMNYDPKTLFYDQPELAPTVYDGLGYNQYASYFNKMGNNSAEYSECEYDDKRNGNNQCTQNQTDYYTTTQRCSPVCIYDYSDGYAKYLNGDPCQKGYTKSDNYKREALQGCMNTDCSDYTPVNKNCPLYKKYENGWLSDLQSISDKPDENGIWNSYYTNPIQDTWFRRLQEYYIPYTVGSPEEITITLKVKSYPTENETTLGVLLPFTPVDPSYPITMTNLTTGTTYEIRTDFDLNKDTGVIKFFNDNNLPNENDLVEVTYTRKGLECDGIFMDTVDTVDVYPSEEFQSKFAELIRKTKEENASIMLVSNRGFTIFDDTSTDVELVMFESYIADYNWDTDSYSLITDEGAINYNNQIHDQLNRLRATKEFEVIGLNYCHNDSGDDDLRRIIFEEDQNRGYISWSTTILLNEPKLIPIESKYAKYETNMFKRNK